MSRVPTSALTDLIDLAKEPSSAKRRELLRQVTTIFMTHPEDIKDSEMALYDTVMSQLSTDMETMVRAEIANTLASARVAPLGLLRKLASDHIDVAEPILTRSRALSESDLVHIVSTQGQDHLRAVSRRENVPESVSGVIVKRGDDTTLHTLLSNDGARLSRASSEEVVQRAQANPALHEVVVGRSDLPPDLMNDMYFVVETRLRERIIAENARLDPSVVETALARGRDKVAVAYGSFPEDYEQISADVDVLRKNEKLTPSLLAKYMRDPNPTWFLVALSQMADIDFLTARHLVEKREIDALAIACKAAGLDKALFLTYAMIMLSDSENAMGRAADYAKLYTDLPLETAQRTIRFWRLRRGEGRAA
ncbi:DUF2336 domain-containing protein [Asticcacaulis sp. EMRT-3]|uniref:DUF2336 domain-containing protein n=1 Tax=Asticcacaulis sp. EMRT-3 TaxID=3040349 RepID=UPI0024AF3392|nr:DUF2336 domain-containing protein [Asticcacaulis sp. EMRT-3]MDI7775398.1 DUF2336 domain-containing protein [Asticcacaulis sp. EMRT-3]